MLPTGRPFVVGPMPPIMAQDTDRQNQMACEAGLRAQQEKTEKERQYYTWLEQERLKAEAAQKAAAEAERKRAEEAQKLAAAESERKAKVAREFAARVRFMDQASPDQKFIALGITRSEVAKGDETVWFCPQADGFINSMSAGAELGKKARADIDR